MWWNSGKARKEKVCMGGFRGREIKKLNHDKPTVYSGSPFSKQPTSVSTSPSSIHTPHLNYSLEK